MQASLMAEEAPALGLLQRALILKTFPGFAALSASELAVLASICRERFFEAGATMLRPGVPVLAFYLIVEGQAQIIRQGRPAKSHGPRSTVGGLARKPPSKQLLSKTTRNAITTLPTARSGVSAARVLAVAPARTA